MSAEAVQESTLQADPGAPLVANHIFAGVNTAARAINNAGVIVGLTGSGVGLWEVTLTASRTLRQVTDGSAT